MAIPLKLTYRHIDSSESLNEMIHDEVQRLSTFCDRIVGCSVTIEQPHRHKRHGRHFRIRVEVHVPGEDIVVGRDPPEHEQYEDARAAVGEVFDSTRRQLQDYVRRVRGDVKHHEEPPRARVARLNHHEGYGFLETSDGREIYFHRNSVLKDRFDELKEGTAVRFTEAQGEKGPQASTVVPC